MNEVEVLYCPTAKKLVRGIEVSTKMLKSGMVQVDGKCPLHAGEKLSKVRYPMPSPFSNLGEIDDSLMMPDITPPIDAGTIDKPSPLFREVFWKSLAQRLAPELKPMAKEIAVTMWEWTLSKPEKERYLGLFERTGRIPLDDEAEKEKPSTGPSKPVLRQNPASEYIGKSKSELQAAWEQVNEEILRHETVLSHLVEQLEADDIEAANAIDSDLMVAARIIGDLDYAKLLAKRVLIMEAMGTA